MSAHDRRSMRRWSYRLRWWPWARRTLLDVAAEDWRIEQEKQRAHAERLRRRFA